jgi:transketolase
MKTEKLTALANTIRCLAIDGVEKAKSGHPGMPMGTADLAAVLWSYHLRFNPKDPNWLGRDRFVLSAGHGSMLLYSLLHLFGYDLPKSELENFRQWESKTPGHPEFGLTPGVETTTGPLGQGFANGVGLALAGKILAARYNNKSLFGYRVYGIVSDGDLMEGVALEAASLAGHLGLSNLTYLYDDNDISIGGSTDVCFTENVGAKFEACGWYVQSVDGHDFEAVNQAIENSKWEDRRPSLIVCRTTIAKGSPNKANTSESHGSPLGAEEVKLTKKALGWPEAPTFYVPDAVGQFCCQLMSEKVAEYENWQKDYRAWSIKNPDSAAALENQVERKTPKNFMAKLADLGASLQKKVATRNISGDILQFLSAEVNSLIGGSADLEPSCLTLIKSSTDVSSVDFKGKNLRFGIREHAMGSIANGLAYTQAFIPYTSTFLVFSDYMRPAIRLAALSHLQTLFIFTHDSFWVGEDGPTHEPIEQIQALRIIPNLYVFRPADGIESAICYGAAIEKKNAPSALLFTRQALEPLKRDSQFSVEHILKGGYVVSGRDCQDLVLVATGSEVSLAQAASELLQKNHGISARVVSIPCMELFFEQDEAYRLSVMPANAKVVTIEAGVTAGWEKISGRNGLNIGLDRYGASAPGNILAEKFGFTPNSIASRVQKWLGR